jgi:quinol monooxygenase YgiN
MVTLGLLATLKAKPGQETAVSDMLKGALVLAQGEDQTVTWYAWQIDANTFGIFDTFDFETGRQAHLNGQIAAALMAKADELLAEPPSIQQIDILAAKV